MAISFMSIPLGLLLIAAVSYGLVMLVRALPSGAGSVVGLVVAGMIAFALFTMVGFRKLQVAVPLDMTRQEEQQLERAVSSAPPQIEVSAEKTTPRVSESTNPSPSKDSADLPAAKPNDKPAWLTEGLQTGNGLTQFPVSSELFASVAECQADLRNRMSVMITYQMRQLFGEDASILLYPGEEQRFTADTYTEEVNTSQGVWYKVHRLVKIDEPARAMMRMRFQEAQLSRRLVWLGLGLGALLLMLSVVYLILRRPPRVVDPTLNTFSTT